MKFNMETAYIPYTSVFEKRNMMFDWIDTSKKAAIFGWIAAIFPALLSCIYYNSLGDFFEFSMYFSSITLGIGGICCKKWKIWAYYINIIAFIYSNTVFVYYMFEIQLKYRVIMVVGDVFGIVMLYCCLRCIYNYNSVYKVLEKEKGFPNFMVNGQDLYADKLYLKNEETEKKVSVNKNTEPIIMNIDVNPSQEEIEQRRNKKHKHGKSILGINIIFPHDDPQDMSLDDKKGYMYDWNCNVEFITKGIFIPIMLMMAGALFCFIAEAKETGNLISFIVGNLSVLLLVIGTNYMKMGKLYGAFITILSLSMYFWLGFYIGAGGNGIPCTWITITSLFNLKIFLPSVRYIINYKMYKELSTHEGFPSFVRNYADIYGSKLYVVEKKEPIKRKILSDNEKIEMNIGYEDEKAKKKKEDKGWNAFDYMDEEKEDGNEN